MGWVSLTFNASAKGGSSILLNDKETKHVLHFHFLMLSLPSLPTHARPFAGELPPARVEKCSATNGVTGL